MAKKHFVVEFAPCPSVPSQSLDGIRPTMTKAEYNRYRKITEDIISNNGSKITKREHSLALNSPEDWLEFHRKHSIIHGIAEKIVKRKNQNQNAWGLK